MLFHSSVRQRFFLEFERLRQGVHFQPVVLNFLDLVPRESGRVFGWFLQSRLGIAVRDDVEPVEVTAVLGYTIFVWREENRARGRADALDFDEPEFARDRMQAGEVKAEVLLLHVLNLAAASLLVGNDGGDGLALRLAVGF